MDNQADPASRPPGRGPVAWTLAVAALALAALMLWKLGGLLLLLFAAILLAIAFNALADGLRRLMPLPRKAAILLSAALIFGVLGAVIALYGWRIQDQYQQIIAKATESAHAVLVWARAHDWSAALLKRANGAGVSDATDTLAPMLGSVLTATSRYLAYGLVVLVTSLFLALDQERYVRAILILVPPARRPRAAVFIAACGDVLRRWLISRVIVMGAIGVLASLGLYMLGIPAALLLGLTGALLTFIPYIGAILAAVPAVLVALTSSPQLAVLTGLMFWGVHTIEGTFITPVVQDEEVYLPAVTTIFSTLACAVLFGPSGVVVASPLVLVVMTAVRLFYLEDVLGEPPQAPPAPRRNPFARRPPVTEPRHGQPPDTP